MNRYFLTSVVALALLSGCASTQVKPQQQKWDFLLVSFYSAPGAHGSWNGTIGGVSLGSKRFGIEEVLTMAGNEGWELVTVLGRGAENANVQLFFKRPLKK